MTSADAKRDLWSVLDSAWLLAAAARVMSLDGQGDTGDFLNDAAHEVVNAAGLSLPSGDAASMLARGARSQLAQMLAVADPAVQLQWAEMDDETLLAQGRASGMNIGSVMAADGPAPDALKARLAQPHARFLDVGTGVGAICVALCRSWPLLHCVGLDIAERPLVLGRREIAEAELEDRVELRRLDVLNLSEGGAFDVAWLPLPLLSGEIAEAALQAVLNALRPGGWILVAANTRSTDPVQAALTAFRAAAVGGGTAYQDDVRRWLNEAGMTDVIEIAPRMGGSPLLAASRRPA